jgi:hypothetical protein
VKRQPVWVLVLVMTGALAACRGTETGFEGTWQDLAGTCSILSMEISQAPQGHRQVMLQTRKEQWLVAASQVGAELTFTFQPGIEGRLYLNGPNELRFYRVFSTGAPEEDIDWKFYRRR